MSDVRLIALDEAHLRALLSHPAAALAPLGLIAEDGALAPDFVYRRALENLAAAPAWSAVLGTHLFVRGSRVVGGGGVKGPPTDEGELEIGYGMAPVCRRQGLGRAAVRLVVAAALASGATRVMAATRPDNEPSWRLLQGLGFVRDGVVEDPEDGVCWRWVFPVVHPR